jgi:NarL family two-component system response regulator LiaR
VKSLRVLLAEDHAVVRESISNFLDQQIDISVVGQASDGEEAVDLTLKLKPDVVVMDISMPKLSGIEATRKIKARRPTTAILILTAYDYDQYIFSLLEAGACGYLLKEVSSQELVEAIRAVNRGESVLHPAVAHKVVERFRQLGSHGKSQALLTTREIDILQAAARGMSNKDIAAEFSLSVRTVEAHFTTIMNKLGVCCRTEAIVRALKNGWLVLDDVA